MEHEDPRAEGAAHLKKALVKGQRVGEPPLVGAEQKEVLREGHERVDGDDIHAVGPLHGGHLADKALLQLAGGVEKDLRAFGAGPADLFKRRLGDEGVVTGGG